MSSVVQVVMAVLGLLGFGCLNTLTMKIQYTLESVGRNGEPKLFAKPFMATFTMFVGMAFVLVPYFGMQAIEAWRSRRKGGNAKEALVPGSGASALKQFLLVSIPSIFDLIASCLMFYGMVFISASTWQMLRGSQLIFAALISVTPVLGRKLYAFNWTGVAFCVLGIIFVGASSMLNPSPESDVVDGDDEALAEPSNALLGMGLVFMAQVVVASQIIAEEKLLKEVNLPALLVVGYEGVWGCILCLAIVFPVAGCIPGPDNGKMEDTIDTLHMLKNNSNLFGLVWLYIFSCASYNISGMAVTSSLSAVHRTMLEASRTLVIWLVDLIVHYCIDKNAGFGEAWLPYSWLQALGFMVLVGGQCVYGGIITIPCCFYPEEFAKAMSPVLGPGDVSPLSLSLQETSPRHA